MTVDLNTDLRSDQRGWGPVWPRSNPYIRPLIVDDVGFPGGMHMDLIPLFSTVLHSCIEDFGYSLITPGCWGYDNRQIYGGPNHTDPTGEPSNHSGGTASDINAPANPRFTHTTDMPPLMRMRFNAYGFRWGGDYSSNPDPMHMEFQGTVADAQELNRLAKEDLVSLTQEQENDLEWVSGFQAYMRQEPEPKRTGPKKRGWNDARVAVEGRPAPH